MKRKVVMLCPDSNHDAEWHWMPANFVFLAATLVDRGYEPIVVDERVLGRERTIKKLDSYLTL